MSIISRIMCMYLLVTVVSALDSTDLGHTARKVDPIQYHKMYDDKGNPNMANLQMTDKDFENMVSYDPDTQNTYLLYTRSNLPDGPDEIVFGDRASLNGSDFSAERRVVVIIHGWLNTAKSEIFKVLVPAFLYAEDVNVIVVDWSIGASTPNYMAAMDNTISSGKSVARFLDWLRQVAGIVPGYHIVGHSLGGHQSGIVGRNMQIKPDYITCLDPAGPKWLLNSDRFRKDDGVYTEVIHTNAGVYGFLPPLGQVDFYVNGGVSMPGCVSDICNHCRSYIYFGASLINGGFTGVQCASYTDAFTGSCHLTGRLQMGGVKPKTGKIGVYSFSTNAESP